MRRRSDGLVRSWLAGPPRPCVSRPPSIAPTTRRRRRCGWLSGIRFSRMRRRISLAPVVASVGCTGASMPPARPSVAGAATIGTASVAVIRYILGGQHIGKRNADTAPRVVKDVERLGSCRKDRKASGEWFGSETGGRKGGGWGVMWDPNLRKGAHLLLLKTLLSHWLTRNTMEFPHYSVVREGYGRGLLLYHNVIQRATACRLDDWRLRSGSAPRQLVDLFLPFLLGLGRAMNGRCRVLCALQTTHNRMWVVLGSVGTCAGPRGLAPLPST